MLNILHVIDDERCFEEVRKLRWPDEVSCPHCSCTDIVKDGHDEKQRARQRYGCRGCDRRFDDLTNTVFAGHHQPLKVWIVVLYLMGLNVSNGQISEELGLSNSDVHTMTSLLRKGVVDRQPNPRLIGEVEFDEVYVVAGHKGKPAAVKKKDGKVVVDGFEAPGEEEH